MDQLPPSDPSLPTPETLPETLVASDPAMLALLARVEQVAGSNATVLITGESGVGKELVAIHLHRSAGPPGRPLVVLNCAAIPDASLDSELFGHEGGAFGPTSVPRIGKFAAASGGTLLLDEIGEMDLRTQAKVLRAVQQREIERVGADRPLRVDVRLVVTTSRDLREEVRLGRFRADLFFRLNVIAVRVPPLRERPGDIAPLAACFARRFARAHNLSANAVTPDGLALLLRHSWPGNVRELENVMLRAALTETGPRITAAAIEIDLLDAPPPAIVVPSVATPETAGPEVVAEAGQQPGRPAVVPTAGRTIEAVERDMILDTLWQCRGNRGQTAATLGISIRTLRNKLHEYERDGSRIPRPVIVAVA